MTTGGRDGQHGALDQLLYLSDHQDGDTREVAMMAASLLRSATDGVADAWSHHGRGDS